MSKKDVFGSFEQISVVVGQHQSTPKVLQDDKAVIEVTSKEIYIGSNGNYKIKWKDVIQLDINDDNDEGFTIHATKHQVVASNPTNPKQWKALSKQLEKLWNKRLEKDRKREQKEKQLERTAVRQPRVYNRNYSKRKSRFATFLEKNENANAWDSEDDEVFNHQRPKRSKIEDLEQHADLQQDAEEKEHEDETMVEDEEPNETTTTIEDHDLSMDAEAAEDEDQDEPYDDSQPLAENDVDEEQEQDSPPTAEQVRSASKSKKTKRRLFQKKRKQIEEDDSDSDDDLFNDDNKNALTTPHKAQRVVSPALSTAGQNRFADEDDEDEDQDRREGHQDEEQENEEDNTGLQNISKFFQPKGKLTKTPITNKPKKTVTPRSKTPTRKPLAEEQPSPSVEDKSSKTSDFFRFGGKKAVAMSAASQSVDSPSKSGDDASTVVPSPTSTQHTEGGNIADESIISTPPRPIQKRPNFFSARKSSSKKNMVEEEDPIVDSPATPSNSKISTPSKALFSSQKRSYMQSKSTASMALELADAHSPTKRSPARGIIQGRPGKLSQRRNKLRRSIVTPVAPPPPPKWRGLRNLGNSCYMNASLQMLYSAPSFIEALQASKDGRSLVLGVCELWRQLQISAISAASPKFIKASVDAKTDKFRGFHQRDAHEFLGHLIDQMHEELESPPAEDKEDSESSSSPKKGEELPSAKAEEAKSSTEKASANDEEADASATDRFFRMNVEVCLECKSCGYSRTKEEMYRYLSIDIDLGDVQDGDTKRTVDKCLENFFQPEDREIKCEKCDDGRTATQTMRILSRPASLLLHLKRFVIVEKPPSENNDTENNGFEITFRKNKAPVQLNESLSLESFMADNSEDAETSYKLQSIVHHLGSTAESGHYTADSARIDKKNDNKETWVSYDDGDASETSLGTIQKSIKNQQTAYMLLYNLEG